MRRKIDLDSKNDNSNFLPNRTHSFYNYESISDEPVDESQLDEDNEEIVEEVVEENPVEEDAVSNENNNRRGLLGRLLNPFAKPKSLNPLSNTEETEEVSTTEKVNLLAKIGIKLGAKSLLIPILIIVGILITIVILTIIICIITGTSISNSVASGGYYAMRCPEVTVIMTDKNNGYKKTGTKTYPLDDYIAGVVSAEVGGFNNIEIYKTFAIAARTYLLNHDNNNCTIESSDRKQVFRDVTAYRNSSASLIYRAVSETNGQVLLSGSGLYGVEYDAFCSIAVDSNYYTIKQQNQKIPRYWVDSQSGIDSSWKQGTCAGNHGRGISQWGAYYLAKEQGLDHEAIIAYYLVNKNVSISTAGAVSTIPGVVLRDTSTVQELHINLSTALQRSNSSINVLNSYIRNNVNKNGSGTREGVVTAATSLINYLYDVPHVRIPYYWGGSYQAIGVNPNFGARVATSVSRNGTAYSYSGFDCSGFVSWAIKNGGYNFSRHNTASFASAFSSDSCDITSSSCIGKPGDLINSASCHVQLIVGVDEKNKTYYVAESTGDYGLIMRPWNMHAGNCGSAPTRILHMDNYYNNKANASGN